MYVRKPTRAFKKSLKRIAYSGDNEIQTEIERIIEILVRGQQLDKKNQDHPLIGELKGYRECHIKPDILLIYHTKGDSLILDEIGSHSQLFR